ncbi:MAG: inositol monophosphatase family protein, partial [Rickettsiales bacterium]
MFSAVTAVSAGIRCGGATALDLAYVAAGRYDAYWSSKLQQPWDIAAGILLIREARGMVTEINGGDAMMNSGSVLASNGLIHKKVDALLGEFA